MKRRAWSACKITFASAAKATLWRTSAASCLRTDWGAHYCRPTTIRWRRCGRGWSPTAYRFDSLIEVIVTSPQFLNKRIGAALAKE